MFLELFLAGGALVTAYYLGVFGIIPDHKTRDMTDKQILQNRVGNHHASILLQEYLDPHYEPVERSLSTGSDTIKNLAIESMQTPRSHYALHASRLPVVEHTKLFNPIVKMPTDY